MKVFFFEPYPIEGPSSRYRVEQYIPYLEANGVKCRVRPFVFPRFYKILYKKGFFLRKIAYFIFSTFVRLCDIPAALCSDVVFIHLEAYPLGPPLLEYFLAFCGKKIVYDLDDAIYLGKTSPSNMLLRYLKCPGKIPAIIRLSRHVITCNHYLAEYVSGFNRNVTVIHTGLDTDKFRPYPASRSGERLVLGWIGSHSTAVYLEALNRVFIRLAKKYDFILKIIGAGERRFSITGVEVVHLDWSLKEEVAQFQSLDIGVYPLPAEEWVLGKTGFKTIQYMSCGIPCVVSNVGTNPLIVKDGENGFLAKSEDEWVDKISRLIENRDLRRKIGSAGRETIIGKYSLKVNAPRLLKVLLDVRDLRNN